MIALSVRAYRGCIRADVRLDPICLVGGYNAAGKSSTAEAAACAATGTVLPIDGMKKGDIAALINGEARTASVMLSDGTENGAFAEIVWPPGEFRTKGSPPAATPTAAGLTSLLDMGGRERGQAIAALLKADPTKADLAAPLLEAGLAQSWVDAVWEGVEKYGWDDAALRTKTQGQKLKGQWEEVTHKNYGSKIAALWQPEGWDSSFINDTDESLRERIRRAGATLEAMVAGAAVSGARRAELEALAAEIDDRRAEASRAVEAHEAATAAVAARRQERAALPVADASAGMPCPHCGERVEMRQVKLGEWRIEKAPAELPADELKKRRMDIAGADGRVSKAVGEEGQANRVRIAAGQALDAALAAQTDLGKVGDGIAPAAIEEARALRIAAETRLQAWTAWRRATQLAEEVRANQVVLAALLPEGVRQQKLAATLDAFNRMDLAPLCAAAGWKPVAIGPTLAITFGERDVRLCSKSEQYRVRALLQLATARRDGSAFVIIDGADILIARERNGLFAALQEAGLPALVCMSLNRRELTPDLAAAGIGQSLWIEDGIAEPIVTQAQGEAA